AIKDELARMWPRVAGALRPGGAAVISGATGAAPATAEEKDFLAAQSELPVRATGSLVGHGIEPQMVMNVALAALAVNRGKLFPPCGALERPMEGALTQAVVTGVGHWRGEGLPLVEASGWAVAIQETNMASVRDKSGRPVVVVTGMGVVPSLGAGKADNWEKLTAGQSGIRAISRFSTGGLRTRIAGTVDFVPVDP